MRRTKTGKPIKPRPPTLRSRMLDVVLTLGSAMGLLRTMYAEALAGKAVSPDLLILWQRQLLVLDRRANEVTGE
jgi:hypothetical protein